MKPLPRPVQIHYLRPPDRRTTYTQELIHDDGRVKVTFAREIVLPHPVLVDGDVVLENGADAVWFTFPGRWYDIGRFHRADGTFTGVYANLITPCVFRPGDEWETTDLFLDLWSPASGAPPVLLDEAELAAAEAAGWISGELARRARSEARALEQRARQGGWPPSTVEAWTRDRAIAALGGTAGRASATLRGHARHTAASDPRTPASGPPPPPEGDR